MGKLATLRSRVIRPQFVVCLVVVCVVGGAFLGSTATPVPPSSIRKVSRKPITHQVQSITTSQPVNCAKVACLALTFDDGPDVHVTPQVLDILEKHNVRATFFVLGSHVGGNETLLRREHKSGHEIGNHSWSHPYFTRMPLEQVRAEITNTQTAIMKAGVPAPHLFRPPYGDINAAVAAHIPLTIIRWNIDPEDWHPTRRAHLLEHMASNVRPGGVVILHDTEPTTAAVLDQLIAQLKASNYAFVTVSELLDLPAGQSGVFFGR